MKEKCDCGKMAVWLYMPGFQDGNDFFCEDCVPRGCECNYHSIDYERVGEENVDWKFVDETRKVWTALDINGLEFPCAEYDYSPEGYDIEFKFLNPE